MRLLRRRLLVDSGVSHEATLPLQVCQPSGRWVPEAHRRVIVGQPGPDRAAALTGQLVARASERGELLAGARASA
jgi:hypothetical protein